MDHIIQINGSNSTAISSTSPNTSNDITRLCVYCGEPIALGFAHRDFEQCTHALTRKVAKLKAELDELKSTVGD